MPIKSTSLIKSYLTWENKENGEASIIADLTQSAPDFSFGSDEITQIYYDELSLPANTDILIDLQDLATNLFTHPLVKSFSTIKHFQVYNTSYEVNIELNNSNATPILWFSTQRIGNRGVFVLKLESSLTISPSAKCFTINNDSDEEVDVKILIAGTE